MHEKPENTGKAQQLEVKGQWSSFWCSKVIALCKSIEAFSHLTVHAFIANIVLTGLGERTFTDFSLFKVHSKPLDATVSTKSEAYYCLYRYKNRVIFWIYSLRRLTGGNISEKSLGKGAAFPYSSCTVVSLPLCNYFSWHANSYFQPHNLYFYFLYMFWPHRYGKYWQLKKTWMEKKKREFFLFFSSSLSWISTRSKRRPILGLCVCFLSGAFLLSSNQLPSMLKPVSGVAKIISVIHVRKRTSSHPSSFPSLKIDIPQKKEPIDARGCYFWQAWLFF